MHKYIIIILYKSSCTCTCGTQFGKSSHGLNSMQTPLKVRLNSRKIPKFTYTVGGMYSVHVYTCS